MFWKHLGIINLNSAISLDKLIYVSMMMSEKQKVSRASLQLEKSNSNSVNQRKKALNGKQLDYWTTPLKQVWRFSDWTVDGYHIHLANLPTLTESIEITRFKLATLFGDTWCFITLTNIWSKVGAFCEKSWWLKHVNCFRKTLLLRCLTGSWICDQRKSRNVFIILSKSKVVNYLRRRLHHRCLRMS